MTIFEQLSHSYFYYIFILFLLFLTYKKREEEGSAKSYHKMVVQISLLFFEYSILALKVGCVIR